MSITRRELFTFWRRKDPPEPPDPPPPSSPSRLRPPGTRNELMLVDTCVRCGKCVAACPADAIYPLGPEHGAAAGTPAIDARKQPCVMCEGLQCSHACPSGALTPVPANRDVLMGTAIVDERRCVTHLGQACDVCIKVCPIPGALVLDDVRLRVDAEKCVGCGLCEHVCPTEPASIMVVPRDTPPPAWALT